MANKYRNVKCTYNGIKFDSQGERDRYKVLELRQKAGEIYALQTQIKFVLVVNNIKVCNYIADFSYIINQKKGLDDQYVVEDFKGVITGLFTLKKKLMKAVYGIDILITNKNNL
jgi:hypothetical protein